MSSNDLRSVNIPIPSSAEDLKEELSEIARRRATNVSRIVAQIYTYAVENQGAFPKEIENPRSKPGKHISTKVPIRIAENLSSWAVDEGRSRAYHCCFLLEYVLEDEKMLKKILD